MNTVRLKQLAQELQQKTEMEQSIKTAVKRQMHMLPDIPKVPNFQFHAMYRPASTVSGDFYDFIQVKPGIIGIALADVTGHGIEAGIIMGMAKKALQIYAKGKESPKETLTITNADLAKDLDSETFITGCYGVLDTYQCTYKYARAGHNPSYLINPNRTRTLDELKPNGMVIGVDKSGKRFPAVMVEQEIKLQTGDLLFQYTDGMVEAHDKQRNEFGEDRLKAMLLQYQHLDIVEMMDLIFEAVDMHRGAQEQEDDITMIGFKVL